MQTISFPQFSDVRCLMMPYIQGESSSVSEAFASYRNIINSTFIKKGEIGFLTIDESPVKAGQPHRGTRAKTNRALHTEAGIRSGMACWGGSPTPGWGSSYAVTLDAGTRIMLANNLDDSCALWGSNHPDTSFDGDIGYAADMYPYDTAVMMKAGEVHEIGIFTPHESLPVKENFNRQFLRIVGAGVHGREPYFTENPLVPFC